MQTDNPSPVHVPDDVLAWLLAGDVSVRYRTHHELLGDDDPALRARITTEGDGAALLAADGGTGHWGRGFYQPKWTSSHYTLLELAGLGAPADPPRAHEVVQRILEEEKGPDGGLDPTRARRASDACVNGMALGYCCAFGADPLALTSVVDFLLRQRMPDGGFNCRLNRGGAHHSSVHTTVCVMEGITRYERHGYRYRLAELRAVRDDSAQFLLRHHLYRSERTGEVIDPELTRLHHPTRWHHDVLRGLEALLDAGVPHDPRMDDALRVIRSKQRADGRWAANRSYPRATHLPNPVAGQPNRWITLVAAKVLKAYGPAV